jgi:hypothetical protein
MKMSLSTFLVLAIAFGVSPYALAREYSDEVCEDFRTVASEFIDMELAGLRWQGVSGNPSCLGRLTPKATAIDRVPASDPSLRNPQYILPENRSVDFNVRRIPGDLLEVAMNYIGKKNKKDVTVKDRFILKMNFGKAREAKGCASWYNEPEHFVMRSRCWK